MGAPATIAKQSFRLDCAPPKVQSKHLELLPVNRKRILRFFREKHLFFFRSNILNKALHGFSHQDLVVQNCGLIPNYTTMYLSWPSLSSQWGTKTTESCSSKQGLET